MVGNVVGALVGHFDGNLVGASICTFIGPFVGAMVGNLIGTMVGHFFGVLSTVEMSWDVFDANMECVGMYWYALVCYCFYVGT